MTYWKNIGYEIGLLYAALIALFFPFSFYLFPFQEKISAVLFEDLLRYFASYFNKLPFTNPEISSDSSSAYLFFLFLFITTCVLYCMLSSLAFWKRNATKIQAALHVMLSLYLSLILFRYGIEKVGGIQFPIPEGNLLYTPLGKLDHDILYWSTIAIPNGYQSFLGWMEIIASLLLLSYRTRNFGVLLSIGIFIQVVAINFCFDISVKLYSSFLLFLSFLLFAPISKEFYGLFLQGKTLSLTQIKFPFHHQKRAFIYKCLFVLFFSIEAIAPIKRIVSYPPKESLFGSYEVTSSTLPLPEDVVLKRIFIHSDHFLIFQYSDDNTEDFFIKIGTKDLEVHAYENRIFYVEYELSKDGKSLELRAKDQAWVIRCLSIPWKELPLLTPSFHWTVDGIQE